MNQRHSSSWPPRTGDFAGHCVKTMMIRFQLFAGGAEGEDVSQKVKCWATPFTKSRYCNWCVRSSRRSGLCHRPLLTKLATLSSPITAAPYFYKARNHCLTDLPTNCVSDMVCRKDFALRPLVARMASRTDTIRRPDGGRRGW